MQAVPGQTLKFESPNPTNSWAPIQLELKEIEMYVCPVCGARLVSGPEAVARSEQAMEQLKRAVAKAQRLPRPIMSDVPTRHPLRPEDV